MRNPEYPELNINVRLLRRIEKYILKYPEKFDMADFLRPVNLTHRQWAKRPVENRRDFEYTLCHTTACIAGWACLTQRKSIRQSKVYVEGEARRLLGLTYGQGQRLFYLSKQAGAFTNHWPLDLERAYLKARKEKRFDDAARIAVERIERFIKTKGAE